jgi:hypothetical protein
MRKNINEFVAYVIVSILTLGMFPLSAYLIDGLTPKDFYHHDIWGNYIP